jgi:uncharacterized protein
LTTEPSTEPSLPPASQLPRPEGLVSRIFLGSDGLRVGWSLLLYGAFWLMMEYAIGVLVLLAGGLKVHPASPQSVILEELGSFLSAYAAAVLMARLERRPAGVYGLPLRQAFGGWFWLGMLLGLGEVSLLVGLIAACGGYSFGTLVLHGSSLLHGAALWAIAFTLVGFSEEFLFRGYPQYTLARGIGFWPAAVCLSLVFGAAHLGNPGEGTAGAANVVVTGLVFALALRRTGNLWLAVGWHASFDFGETFLFSVPNSGYVFDQHLSSAVLHGKTWLTGGTVGPEGSVFGFLTLGISAVLIHYLFPAKKHLSHAPADLVAG